MMVNKITLTIILATTLFGSLYSQDLKEIKRIEIAFGMEKEQIGIDKGGGEHWKPLFFDVDKKGNIHIPDFYKQRIAVFNDKGGFIDGLTCKEGISPRMNFFSITPQGFYVSFNDYTLFLLNDKGKVNWQKQLGFGAIPQFIYANGVAIFLSLPADDGRSVVFDYFSNRPIGKLGFMENNTGIPLIQNSNRDKFTFSLSHMKKIPDSSFKKTAFSGKEEAFLLATDLKSNSLWKRKLDGEDHLFLYNKSGGLLGKGVIRYPKTGIEGNGFWTAADENMQVYKNYFFDDYMEIVVYKFL
ncbi:MAG: hypothetical protein JW969_21085 [Spirochaetales bacterium]|nr:hypothetical protein [Spirochaetales bacterium]